MASAPDLREASLCDESKQNPLLQSLFDQKLQHQFCDVLIKVCNKDIYAHSNVLAATSPYFEVFLKQDLPRLFSQRSPQIIVIQVDGNEPNELYENAVSAIINFVYTGSMTVTTGNATQIFEISKIMQLSEIVSFCEDFLQGRVQNGSVCTIPQESKGQTTDTLNSLSESLASQKHSFTSHQQQWSKKLVSVAVQTTSSSQIQDAVPKKACNPDPEGNQVRNSKRKAQSQELPKASSSQADQNHDNVPEDIIEQTVKKIKVEKDSWEDEKPPTVTRSGRVVIPKRYDSHDFKTDKKVRKASIKETVEKSVKRKNRSASNSEMNIQKSSPEKVDDFKFPKLSTITSITSDEMVLGKDQSNIYSSETEETAQDETFNAESASADYQMVQDENMLADSEDNESFLNSDINKSVHESPQKTVLVSFDGENDFDEIETLKRTDSNGDNDTNKDAVFNSIKQEFEDSGSDYNPEYDDLDEDPELDVEPDSERTTEIAVVRKKGRPKKVILTSDSMSDSVLMRPSKEYSCSECSFVTSRVREISAHTMCHKRDQGVCFYCDKAFSNKEELAKHTQTHKGLQPFECLKCGITFKTRTMLNLHLPKHSNVKPFHCEICSMSFKWKHALKNHMVVHSNKREHLCDICGYSTAHKSQLRSHSLIHTGDTFKCDFPDCNFQTTKKQNLQFHRLTHTRERPHQCDVCGQNFSLLKNMKRHLKLHYTEKEHRCQHCGFATTRYDKLKEHLLRQHATGTPPERRVKVADMAVQGELNVSDNQGVSTEEPQTLMIAPLENQMSEVSKKESAESFAILTHLLEGGAAVGEQVSTTAQVPVSSGHLSVLSGQEVTADHVTTVDLEHLQTLEGVNSILVTEDGNQVILNGPSFTLQELTNALRKNEEGGGLVARAMELSQQVSAIELPQQVSAIELPQAVSATNVELSQQVSAVELPQQVSAIELPTQVSAIELPQHVSAVELPQTVSGTTVQLPQQVSAIELPQQVSATTIELPPAVSATSLALEAAPSTSQVPLQIVKEEDQKTVQYLEVLVDAANTESNAVTQV